MALAELKNSPALLPVPSCGCMAGVVACRGRAESGLGLISGRWQCIEGNGRWTLLCRRLRLSRLKGGCEYQAGITPFSTESFRTTAGVSWCHGTVGSDCLQTTAFQEPRLRDSLAVVRERHWGPTLVGLKALRLNRPRVWRSCRGLQLVSRRDEGQGGGGSCGV